MVTVHFPVPPEAAFDYLTDPAHRPEWQASLRAVESVEGDVGLGQRWVDVTVPGLRPQMATTAYERPGLWTEVGTWHGIRAELTLRFTAAGAGCEVSVSTRFSGRGAWKLAVPFAMAGAPLAARTDLKAAAKAVGTSSGQ